MGSQGGPLVQGCVANAPTAGAGVQTRPSTYWAVGRRLASAGAATCREVEWYSRARTGVTVSMVAASSPADKSFTLVIQFLRWIGEAKDVRLLDGEMRMPKDWQKEHLFTLLQHGERFSSNHARHDHRPWKRENVYIESDGKQCIIYGSAGRARSPRVTLNAHRLAAAPLSTEMPKGRMTPIGAARNEQGRSAMKLYLNWLRRDAPRHCRPLAHLNCGITGTVMRGGGSGGILDALPIPLGSTVTLFKPPGLAGPGGIPLIGTFPVPASPAIRANEVVGAAMSSNAKVIFIGMFDMMSPLTRSLDVQTDLGRPIHSRH